MYQIANVDKSKYKDWTLDTELTREEAIEAYRIISGSCKNGTKNFVECKLPKDMGVSSKVKISDIINCSKGRYGSKQFEKFFLENSKNDTIC